MPRIDPCQERAGRVEVCSPSYPAMLTSVTTSLVKAAQVDKMISQNVQMIFPRTNFMIFLWDSFGFSGELYEKDRK